MLRYKLVAKTPVPELNVSTPLLMWAQDTAGTGAFVIEHLLKIRCEITLAFLVLVFVMEAYQQQQHMVYVDTLRCDNFQMVDWKRIFYSLLRNHLWRLTDCKSWLPADNHFDYNAYYSIVCGHFGYSGQQVTLRYIGSEDLNLWA